MEISQNFSKFPNTFNDSYPIPSVQYSVPLQAFYFVSSAPPPDDEVLQNPGKSDVAAVFLVLTIISEAFRSGVNGGRTLNLPLVAIAFSLRETSISRNANVSSCSCMSSCTFGQLPIRAVRASANDLTNPSIF